MENLLSGYAFRHAHLKYIDDIREICRAFEFFSMPLDSEPVWVKGRLGKDTYFVTGIEDGIDVRLFKKDTDSTYLLGVWICRKVNSTAELELRIWPYTSCVPGKKM